jgi:hypothetical protein
LKITAFTRYSYILDTKNAEISRKLEKIQVHQNTSRETPEKRKSTNGSLRDLPDTKSRPETNSRRHRTPEEDRSHRHPQKPRLHHRHTLAL